MRIPRYVFTIIRSYIDLQNPGAFITAKYFIITLWHLVFYISGPLLRYSDPACFRLVYFDDFLSCRLKRRDDFVMTSSYGLWQQNIMCVFSNLHWQANKIKTVRFLQKFFECLLIKVMPWPWKIRHWLPCKRRMQRKQDCHCKKKKSAGRVLHTWKKTSRMKWYIVGCLGVDS